MKKNKDLRDFLDVVKKGGSEYYIEINKPLDPHLEVGVITHKLYKADRTPVVFCPEMKGSKLPLVTNMISSYELLGVAMGMEPGKVVKSEILHEYMKRESDRKAPVMVSAADAPVKEVIIKGKDVDLGSLPIPFHAPLDSGKYITSGNLICKDPATGTYNVGMYRHEVKGKDELGFMINPVHDSNYIAKQYAELGQEMEVAIFLGHHPSVVLGSMYMGPKDIDELEVIGGLLGEPLRMTQAETVDIPVPADAEIVIEGTVDPRNMIKDGPFGEFTWHYGEGEKACYLIKVKAITMRKDAIYHDITPAHAEHNIACALGFEAPIYEGVKKVVPSVKAVHMPASGFCVFHLYVSIKKTVSGQGKSTGVAALGSSLSHVKTVIVVDEDIDIYDERDILFALASRMVPTRDISIISNACGNHLDPSATNETRLQKGYVQDLLVIDATNPLELPTFERVAPSEELWNKMDLADYIS